MIRLTSTAFLRRHNGGYVNLKRDRPSRSFKQSHYNVRDRDDLLNDIESMEINSVFERVTGLCASSSSPSPASASSEDVTDDVNLGNVNPQSAKASSGQDNMYNFDEIKDEYSGMGTFVSMRSKCGFSDLTHEERHQLQHFEAQSRLSDPSGLLNKNRAKVDPRRDAKNVLKHLDDLDYDGEHTYSDTDGDPRGALLVKENRFDEIISRIRAKMRQEKLESSKITKARVPNFNGMIVDPIAKHVKRRCLRINAMIKEHLEQIITCNDPSFIFGDLKGISISLKRVEMTSGKSTIKCYYGIMGGDFDDGEIQAILEKAQKKVRFCLARKLELGYTPPVVFIKSTDSDVGMIKRMARSPDNAFNMPLDTTMSDLQKVFHKKMVAF